MNVLRETFVIWDAEWRRTVRSGRAMVLLGVYGLFSMLVLFVIGGIINAIRAQVEAQVTARGSATFVSNVSKELKQGILGLLARNDPALLESMSEVPLEVLLVFKVTLFFLPLYVALVGFDQVSGEVGPRSIRYLTVRARRTSVLLGKFLSQATVVLAVVLTVDLVIFVFAAIINPDFALSLLVVNLLKFWLAAMVFALAYLALTSLCSSLLRTPALSLTFNFALLFSFWLLDVVGGLSRQDGPLRYVSFLSPSHYTGNLLHPQLSQFGTSALAYLTFALVFLGSAHLVLSRRDL